MRSVLVHRVLALNDKIQRRFTLNNLSRLDSETNTLPSNLQYR
jgi:hypothetical protein